MAGFGPGVMAYVPGQDQLRWQLHLDFARSCGCGKAGGMMASTQFTPDVFSRRRISLADIDAGVSARLGPTRGLGNSQPACFNRQVGMYLARHVGRWSTTVIGRFYNGRDHSTVCYGIQRIEALRESDPDVDALISDLKHELSICGDSPLSKTAAKPYAPVNPGRCDLQMLADLIAERVYARLKKRPISDENGALLTAAAIDSIGRKLG